MEYKLNGNITVEADGTLSIACNVYSKDAREEYGMLIVKHGELVATFGKKKKLTDEVWPAVKQAFHL